MDWRLDLQALSTYKHKICKGVYELCPRWGMVVCCLKMGDNFDANVKEGNNERQDFWIVCCTKPIHTLTKPLKCKWGTDYCERDKVVGGKYYKKWGNYNTSYVFFKDSNVVYLFSHLVRFVKFLMLPKNYCASGNDALFELLNDATIGIQFTIATLDA
jgi:hypothetical protein